MFLVIRLMRNWLKSKQLHVWVLALVGMLDVLGGTYAVDLLDLLLGWCSGLCLIWTHPSVSCWCFVCWCYYLPCP